MAAIERTAKAVWQGESRTGKGMFGSSSGALKDIPYTWKGRFEDEPGTNPEELIAAAHASCFSMALASGLGKAGHQPGEISTTATLFMERGETGFSITRIRLETEGQVPNISDEEFRQAAEDAGKNCPISRLLKPGLQSVEVVAKLRK